MKLVIIIAVISIAIIAILAVLVIPSMPQQNLDSTDEDRDKIIWQKLQKTYLEQECREKYLGQLDEMEECFDRVKEEQRLNPPTELGP